MGNTVEKRTGMRARRNLIKASILVGGRGVCGGVWHIRAIKCKKLLGRAQSTLSSLLQSVAKSAPVGGEHHHVRRGLREEFAKLRWSRSSLTKDEMGGVDSKVLPTLVLRVWR